MNTTDKKEDLKALLKELCEVCPDKFTTINETVYVGMRGIHFSLRIRDGQIHGGEALWSMLQEMRERWEELRPGYKAHFTGDSEILAMCDPMLGGLGRLNATTLIRAYIAWQRSKATVEEEK